MILCCHCSCTLCIFMSTRTTFTLAAFILIEEEALKPRIGLKFYLSVFVVDMLLDPFCDGGSITQSGQRESTCDGPEILDWSISVDRAVKAFRDSGRSGNSRHGGVDVDSRNQGRWSSNHAMGNLIRCIFQIVVGVAKYSSNW
jgi:hypothetical protein